MIIYGHVCGGAWFDPWHVQAKLKMKWKALDVFFSEYFSNALNIKVNICITNPWVSEVLYLKDNSALKRHLCTYVVIYFID